MTMLLTYLMCLSNAYWRPSFGNSHYAS